MFIMTKTVEIQISHSIQGFSKTQHSPGEYKLIPLHTHIRKKKSKRMLYIFNITYIGCHVPTVCLAYQL
jgi:hypothetical protein